nr:unnamed protein product [Spirometra erinaceieuropaei]
MLKYTDISLLVADICSENLGQTTAPTGQFDTTRSNVLQEIKRCSPIGKPVRRRQIVAPASASEILEYQIASDSESENFVAGTLPALCSKATSSCKGENLEDYLQSSDSEGSLSSFPRAPHARQPSNLESLSHVRRSTSPFVFPDIEDNSQAVKGQIDFAVISSSSEEEEEEETSVCDQKHPLHKGLDPATLFSATEEHQQTLFRKYFPPPTNIIRSKLSARLDTLLHRHQSNRVIWLHKKNPKQESGVVSPFVASSGTKDDHGQQTFRIKSIRLPSQVFIRRYASQVCLLASTENQSADVIIFIPSSTLTDEQLNLLRGSLGRQSLEVSLFKPWYELRTAPTLCTSDRPTRTIFAPFMATFRRSSVPPPPDEIIHLSVECDCLKKGSTETCPRRYGPGRADHNRLLWTPELEPATSSLLVLHKSLCWCQHKLRFVFILNFTGGFLAVLLVPTSVFALGRQGMRRTSCALANLGAGCVCEVSDLQALPQASNDE